MRNLSVTKKTEHSPTDNVPNAALFHRRWSGNEEPAMSNHKINLGSALLRRFPKLNMPIFIAIFFVVALCLPLCELVRIDTA